MKTLVTVVFASVTCLCSAQMKTILGNPPPDGTNRTSKIRQRIYERTGGFFTRKDSQKGHFLVLDCQSTVAASNFLSTTTIIDKRLNYRVACERGEAVSVGEWNRVRAKREAEAMVAIVADDVTPSLLVSPDERWAVINVKKLDKGITTDSGKAKFLPIRARRQFIRACALMAGSLSQFKSSPASVQKIEDLDEASDVLPMDQLEMFGRYLSACGMSPRKFASYKMACEEGWAPAPTNDVQKAIWDKVHAMPTAPIKIKPETKKVAE